jgi:hypothetical protein
MNNLPNGGFPPIKYCKNTKDNKKDFTKERYFASSINQIFSSKNIKPLVIDISKNNDTNEINEINEL